MNFAIQTHKYNAKGFKIDVKALLKLPLTSNKQSQWQPLEIARWGPDAVFVVNSLPRFGKKSGNSCLK
jgi:hypothetical protein